MVGFNPPDQANKSNPPEQANKSNPPDQANKSNPPEQASPELGGLISLVPSSLLKHPPDPA